MAVELEASGSGSSSRSYDIKQRFEGFRGTLDANNERRERLIISSRQITSLSKKLIFHLHRISLHPVSSASSSSLTERDRILDEAEEKVKEIAEWVGKVGEELKDGEVGYWAFSRNISPGIQEYIEGASFLHYLRHGVLITLTEVRDTMRDGEGRELVEITSEDYALGISDLSGELMRYATNCSSTGDYKAALAACQFVRDLKSGLDSAQPFVRDLGKKQQITEQSLLKIEKVCYAIQLRILEYGDRPEVLAHLAKRALEEQEDGGPDGGDGFGG